MTVRALAISLPIVTWVTAFASWRLVLRRLGIAKPSEGVGARERLVLRNLRALLAFNFLVWYPVAVPGGVAMLFFSGMPSLERPALAMLLAVALFSLPLPPLLASARKLERDRLAGVPPRDAPTLWMDDVRAAAGADRPFILRATLAGILLAAAGGCLLVPFAGAGPSRAVLTLLLGTSGFIVYARGFGSAGAPGGLQPPPRSGPPPA